MSQKDSEPELSLEAMVEAAQALRSAERRPWIASARAVEMAEEAGLTIQELVDAMGSAQWPFSEE